MPNPSGSSSWRGPCRCVVQLATRRKNRGVAPFVAVVGRHESNTRLQMFGVVPAYKVIDPAAGFFDFRKRLARKSNAVFQRSKKASA
jgi:hypothetical protein